MPETNVARSTVKVGSIPERTIATRTCEHVIGHVAYRRLIHANCFVKGNGKCVGCESDARNGGRCLVDREIVDEIATGDVVAIAIESNPWPSMARRPGIATGYDKTVSPVP